jgi:hypothetical protein
VNKEKSQDTSEFVAATFIARKSTVFSFHLTFVCACVPEQSQPCELAQLPPIGLTGLGRAQVGGSTSAAARAVGVAMHVRLHAPTRLALPRA